MTNIQPSYSKGALFFLLSPPPTNYLHCAARCHLKTQWQGQRRHSQEPQCFCLSVCTVLNIWTLLIKSYLDSVLLSLSDSKVIKLLKGVTGKIVVSRLRQERLIKWPLLLLTSSKSAFFYPRQANVRECGFFFPRSTGCASERLFFFLFFLSCAEGKKKKRFISKKDIFFSLTMLIQNSGLLL